MLNNQIVKSIYQNLALNMEGPPTWGLTLQGSWLKTMNDGRWWEWTESTRPGKHANNYGKSLLSTGTTFIIIPSTYCIWHSSWFEKQKRLVVTMICFPPRWGEYFYSTSKIWPLSISAKSEMEMLSWLDYNLERIPISAPLRFWGARQLF